MSAPQSHVYKTLNLLPLLGQQRWERDLGDIQKEMLLSTAQGEQAVFHRGP